MNKKYISTTIVNDSDSDSDSDCDNKKNIVVDNNNNINNNNINSDNISDDISDNEEIIIQVPVKRRKNQPLLKPFYFEDTNVYEIGVDEVGRGPLFGRVYTAAVILPKDNTFDHFNMKDSKKFSSNSKITEMAEYIKLNALAWTISYENEKTIDEINILQATQKSMTHSIVETRKQFMKKCNNNDINFHLLIDGNYFKPINILNKKTNKLQTLPYTTIKGGDNLYSSIAAASILAKVERDKYIEQLCVENPLLTEHYNIQSNKGYGAKVHIDGIQQYGITQWHRRSFGICKKY
jgi:ribonuclease HII